MENREWGTGQGISNYQPCKIHYAHRGIKFAKFVVQKGNGSLKSSHMARSSIQR